MNFKLSFSLYCAIHSMHHSQRDWPPSEKLNQMAHTDTKTHRRHRNIKTESAWRANTLKRNKHVKKKFQLCQKISLKAQTLLLFIQLLVLLPHTSQYLLGFMISMLKTVFIVDYKHNPGKQVSSFVTKIQCHRYVPVALYFCNK